MVNAIPGCVSWSLPRRLAGDTNREGTITAHSGAAESTGFITNIFSHRKLMCCLRQKQAHSRNHATQTINTKTQFFIYMMTFALSVIRAFAAAGDLDTTFDSDAKLTTIVSTNDFSLVNARAVLAQRGGKQTLLSAETLNQLCP